MLFYCGTQKAGSSWLQWALRQNPQLSVGPYKEWHFWHGIVAAPRDGELRNLAAAAEERVRSALFTARRRNPLGRVAQARRLEAKWKHVRDSIQYDSALSQWVSLNSMFDVGDFTPNYIRMSAAQWAEIAAATPTARVIISVRDPVQRAWSEIRMDRSHWTRVNFRNEEQLNWFVQNPRSLELGRISTKVEEILRLWPRSQILLTSLDQIAYQPERVVAYLAELLGVPPWPVPRKTVNAGNPEPIPSLLHRVLEKHYSDERQHLEDLVGQPLRV